jgi:CheY-like chemotaxis protein
VDKPLRVLFIEDSRKDAELVCGELKRGGYCVHSGRVDTESGFLAALTTETWDLIISDFSMPQFDGLRAFELFRAHELDIPFIFVSGVMGEDRAVQAMKAGARDYILKGQLGRLNAAVDRELEEAARRRQGRETDAAKAREQRRLAVALQATGAGVFEYRIPADHRGYCDQRFANIFGLELDELPPFEQFPAWFLQQVHPGGPRADQQTPWRLHRRPRARVCSRVSRAA